MLALLIFAGYTAVVLHADNAGNAGDSLVGIYLLM
jgi:hypothetical protein